MPSAREVGTLELEVVLAQVNLRMRLNERDTNTKFGPHLFFRKRLIVYQADRTLTM